MKNISKPVKELITKILQPESKRISAIDIFADSWVLKENSRVPLKLSYSRLSNFSKYSKVNQLLA